MDTPHGATAGSSNDEVRRFCGWGQVFKREGRLGDAAAAFAAALQIDPNDAEAHNELGAVFHLSGNESDAISEYRRALELAPGHVNALSNLATALLERNQVVEAIETYKRALAIEPEQAKIRTFLGLAQLLSGDLVQGLENYQQRWAAGATRPASATGELWVGQRPLKGRSIWLASEQGLGDMIQFSRYVRWVHAQGPAKMFLETPPALERLFALSFGDIAEVHRIEKLVTKPFCDEVTTVPSLALAARTGLDTIPREVPYLKAPEPTEETRWRLETLPRGVRVGLAWAGNPTHHNDRRRSIEWQQFQKCLVHGNACYVSLQKETRMDNSSLGGTTAEIIARSGAADTEAGTPRSAWRSKSAFEVTDFRDCLHDMAESAAVINALDLVITVDTSIAHLAGALGKPVWVLLPFSPDWRWLLARSNSPWYPTMRLFRQKHAGDWENVFAEVRAELQKPLGA